MRKISACLALGLAINAFAAGKKDFPPLSVAGGIAAPAGNTAVFQNPSGLIYAEKLSFNAYGASQFDSLSTVSAGGGLLYGNGTVALAGGAMAQLSGGSQHEAFYGLGFKVKSIKTAFGLSGSTSLNGGGSAFNAGVLLRPEERLRFGFTAINLENIDEVGAGFAYDVVQGVVLVGDAAVDSDFANLALQPGIMIYVPRVAVTISYGFHLAGNGTYAQVSDEIAVGGHLQVSKTVSWQVYYKQMSRYFTAVSVAL